MADEPGKSPFREGTWEPKYPEFAEQRTGAIEQDIVVDDQAASNVLHVGANSLGSEVLDADLYCLGLTDLQLSASEVSRLDQYLASLMS